MKIKEYGVRAGLAISPDTSYDVVLPYLDLVDMVLIMTVEPGFGGQKLIPETLKKIKALKKYCDENNYNIDIEVDGGIGPDNIGLLTSNGANIIVAGSAVFKAENYGEVISKMLSEAEKNPYNS
jgi:ribulose-phosphate 3-epimerase